MSGLASRRKHTIIEGRHTASLQSNAQDRQVGCVVARASKAHEHGWSDPDPDLNGTSTYEGVIFSASHRINLSTHRHHSSFHAAGVSSVVVYAHLNIGRLLSVGCLRSMPVAYMLSGIELRAHVVGLRPTYETGGGWGEHALYLLGIPIRQVHLTQPPILAIPFELDRLYSPTGAVAVGLQADQGIDTRLSRLNGIPILRCADQDHNEGCSILCPLSRACSRCHWDISFLLQT